MIVIKRKRFIWIRRIIWAHHICIYVWALESPILIIYMHISRTTANMLQYTSKSMRFHLNTSWMHTIVILIVVFILNSGKLNSHHLHIAFTKLPLFHWVIFHVKVFLKQLKHNVICIVTSSQWIKTPSKWDNQLQL